MQNAQQRFSLTERIAVVAIILIVTAIAIQNLLQSVSESEERTWNNAAAEYSAVKSMYAEHRQNVPPSMGPMHAPTAVNTQNRPIK